MVRRIVLAALAVVLLVAASGAEEDPSPVRHRGYSIKDSPGYVPLVDPESTAVVLGRRVNAPLVEQPFSGGAASLDELGRAVCRAFERGTRDSLMRLTVTQEEFRDILWREFPQSRPVTGLAWEDGWKVLYPRLLNGSVSAWNAYGGGFHDFVRFERDTIVAYKNFTLHNGLVLVARNAAGELERLTWLRSVAERKGRFKIYSMRD